MVVIRERKRRKTRTYKTRKDDVEPTSRTPTYLRYLMIVKENLGNSVCMHRLDGKPTYLTLLDLT